ncbi:serine/threonine-protein kinase [Nocardia bovistercoris]|uniref:serine/threonine-protein kinase n=1 Tax=Nocardia bovistercoris TaxID=2785916 RepID=UPI002FCCF050
MERLLGRGGMGAVYLARHPRLPRLVALKLLNRDLYSDNEIRARFEREADLAARLDHPNIVTVFDRGVDDEQLWIAMQYIDGVDASSLDPSALPPQRGAQIVAETATALDYAHAMGVLHRDVKPANIMLARGVGMERVLLTDFGIARPREDTAHLTRTGTFTATLTYASPEQLTGAYMDHRTDQYSLACTLFWLLTGKSPFDSSHPALIIDGHLRKPPPPITAFRPGLPAELDAILARAMAKRSEDRFATCAEFANLAWAALNGRPTPSLPVITPSSPTLVQPFAPAPSAPRVPVTPGPQPNMSRAYPPPMRPIPAPPRRRRRIVPLTPLVIVLVVLVGFGVWVWRDDSSILAEATGRTPELRALAAVSAAFPDMLPTDPREEGKGYRNATCRPRTEDLRLETNAEAAFNGWMARWYCFTTGSKALNYTFYVYRSQNDATTAVGEFALRAKLLDTATFGNRKDRRLTFTKVVNGTLRYPKIVSTFTDPSRATWVMTFDYNGPEPIQDLIDEVARAPLT